MKYTDELVPDFGVPWPPEFRWEKGELASGLSEGEALALAESDPARAKFLADMLRDQPEGEARDPVTWGWTLDSWRRIFDTWEEDKIIVLFGGNRSTKTTFASRLLVWLLMNVPEAELRSFHVTEDRSIEDTQRLVWESLPLAFREMRKKRSAKHSITYSAKNGFTDGKLILPPQEGAKRGSYLRFNNYRQFLQDAQIIEGMTAHCIHLEEECPARLFETLLARVADYHGKIIMTFTTLQGWTDLVNGLLHDAKTVRTRYSEYLGMDLPVEQLSANWEGCRIHYLWSEDNPFFNFDELRKSYSKQTFEVKLARLYGVPKKTYHNRFPKFNPHVNVVGEDEMPWAKDPDAEVTRYMICDPAGSKPWVMVWVAVDVAGRWWVYREWPDSTMGPWALPHTNNQGKPVGKPGPAAKPLGMGYRDYAEMMKEMEDEEEIFERLVDPRFGRATVRTLDGETDMVREMMKVGIFFRPAPGLDVEHGLQKINDLLAWDDSEALTEVNRPSFYVSERCENVRYAMTEYSGTSRDEQCKDWIDVLRYGAVTPLEYVGAGELSIAGGGSY